MKDRSLATRMTMDVGQTFLYETNIEQVPIRGRISEIAGNVQVNFISALNEGEVRFGVARRLGATKLEQIVEEFLLRVTILPWDSDAARQYGQLRAELERVGQPMGNLDMMIGAHAAAAGLVLVSNDRAFARIKKLKIQDWTI